MKKLFTLILSFTTWIVTLHASDIEVDGIWYNFNDSAVTAEVTYKGSDYYYTTAEYKYSGVVVIPSEVVYNNNIYTVTSMK